MKIISCNQRGADWFSARLGKPTASGMAEIVTTTGKQREGAAPRRYMLDLLGERLTGLPTQAFETAAMIRGVELEPRARAWYELITGREVVEVGFVLSDCGRFGCSPDGLMDERGLEIKCPMQAGFLDVIESGAIPFEHVIQMQASMWVTGFKEWDYCLFTDVRGLAPQIITVQQDARIQDALSKYVPAFCDELDKIEARLRERGHGYKNTQEKGDEHEQAVDGDPFA